MADSMVSSADRTLRTSIRREIARTCAAGPRSVGDIAGELGRPDGALRATVQRMAREGVLLRTALPGRRADGFALAPAWRPAVAALKGEPDDPGRLSAAGRVLCVAGPLDALLVALADVSEMPGFAWAARLGPERFLVFLDGTPEQDDDVQVHLRRGGCDLSVAENVLQVLGPRELRVWAARADRDRTPEPSMKDEAERAGP